MSELVKRRDTFVAAEAAKQPATQGDSFDRKVTETLSSQF